MKGGISIALLGVLAATWVGQAQQPAEGGGNLVLSERRSPLLPPVEDTREPWLGVSVTKPSEAVSAQLPQVPRGVGFIVHRLVQDGPAGKAGMRQNDFLWKLDDQYLVNEAQFLTLLNMKKVGARVRLTVQRAGESHEFEAELGVRPDDERGRDEADVAILAAPPLPGLPRQLVDVLRRMASIRDETGTIRMERDGTEFYWQHIDLNGKKVEEGRLVGGSEEDFPVGMPAPLKGKLQALIRAFKDAERRAEGARRIPRVRRVPESAAPGVRNP